MNRVLTDLLEAADISDECEEDIEIQSTHDIETETEMSDEDFEATEPVDTWYGKDNTAWSKEPVRIGRTPMHNIVTSVAGLQGPARANPPTKPKEALNLMKTTEMLDEILIYTNSKLRSIRVLEVQKVHASSEAYRINCQKFQAMLCSKFFAVQLV